MSIPTFFQTGPLPRRTLDRTPHPECTAGLVSCSGLILILLLVVLIGVVTAGFFVIIYYVDRDEDLRQYAGARMPLATTDQGDPSADLLGPHV